VSNQVLHKSKMLFAVMVSLLLLHTKARPLLQCSLLMTLKDLTIISSLLKDTKEILLIAIFLNLMIHFSLLPQRMEPLNFGWFLKVV
jgi:hypothetical protein